MKVTVAKFLNIKTLLPVPLWTAIKWWVSNLGYGQRHGVEIGHDDRGRCLFVEYLHLGPFTLMVRVYSQEHGK